MTGGEIEQSAIDALYRRLEEEAEGGGYHLNPDVEFTRGLIRGLLVNERRYGYQSCPCRLASGSRSKDLDIICPCYYRDPDLNQYGACYCALYVSGDVLRGKRAAGTVPERRPPDAGRGGARNEISRASLAWPVWRCQVCGYLCARTNPPEVCPICRATQDRFERFL